MMVLHKYVWRCGKSRASLEMSDVDMERLAETEFGIRKMTSEVCKVLGNGHDHIHIFSETKSSDKNVVVFDCPGANNK